MTVTGKRIPIDAKPTAGNLILNFSHGSIVARVVAPGLGTHVSHFATCPNAEQHRNKAQGTLPSMDGQ